MNIMIMGGTGLLGRRLTENLVSNGHQVALLTRNPQKYKARPNITILGWDGKTAGEWSEQLGNMDALVNLAGATIGAYPWNASRKQEILNSRINAAQAAYRALEKSRQRPPTYLQASGVGYYGACGPESVDESSPIGNDFLAEVAMQWESASKLIDSLGVRRVIMRTSVVLAPQGGSLALMSLPVKFFSGGPLGDGKQGFSWIHIDDYVTALEFLLQNDMVRGVCNITAPNPVSSADFMRALADALHRPYWLTAPSFALKLALGEMSDLLLHGQYAIPRRIVEAGFRFRYEQVQDALKNIYDNE